MLKPKLHLNKINIKHTKIKKHGPWNCCGYKANYDKLLLLIAELNPTAICLQETFKKHSDKLNIKTFEQYDYMHNTGQRASGGVSILIRKDIPQNKISINTHLQAITVSATLHKTVTICSLYIPPHHPINENELNTLIQKLPKPFILMGDFNSHNIIWVSKTTNKRGQILEKIINRNNLCLYNQNSQTHLNPSSGSFSAIDLTLSDPSIFTDYNWRVTTTQ